MPERRLRARPPEHGSASPAVRRLRRLRLSLTLLFTVPDKGLLIYLGVFAGFLLYIGASDILPEAHADHPSLATLSLTVAGAVMMYGVTEVLP